MPLLPQTYIQCHVSGVFCPTQHFNSSTTVRYPSVKKFGHRRVPRQACRVLQLRPLLYKSTKPIGKTITITYPQRRGYEVCSLCPILPCHRLSSQRGLQAHFEDRFLNRRPGCSNSGPGAPHTGRAPRFLRLCECKSVDQRRRLGLARVLA